MKYDNRIKIRFWTWGGMNYPFRDDLSAVMYWRIWSDIEYILEEWLGKSRFIIQLPWVIFLVIVLFPLPACGILKNNARILWRYFKRIVYRSLKGLK